MREDATEDSGHSQFKDVAIRRSRSLANSEPSSVFVSSETLLSMTRSCYDTNRDGRSQTITIPVDCKSNVKYRSWSLLVFTVHRISSGLLFLTSPPFSKQNMMKSRSIFLRPYSSMAFYFKTRPYTLCVTK